MDLRKKEKKIFRVLYKELLNRHPLKTNEIKFSPICSYIAEQTVNTLGSSCNSYPW